MLIDSHCHLDRVDLKPWDQDFDRFVDDTRAGGVDHMLCVSIDLESYPAMRSLVAHRPEISISVGVHPNDRDRREPSPEELAALADDPKNVAIGETGLDYFRSEAEEGETLDWQRDRFRRHIRAAHLCGKPLIIHTRAARADTLTILREEQAREVGGVMHCFTEDWDTASAALDLGFYISLSGIVTFRNADELREVARQVPNDRLLVETDSPYLAPIPHRGKPNVPGHVRHVAECLAELRGVSLEKLAGQTSENYQRLFGGTG